jgi:phage baseplate assembly protein W|tara:strand:+ start:5734 stop:6126 length:393 start_codon:yes stop_codon:yes gene_type:complete
MSKYKDLNLSLDRNSFTGDVSVTTDANAIRQSLTNILLTEKNERPFSSAPVGIGIKRLLFDVDVLSSKFLYIKELTKELINRYEPRVIYDDMEIMNFETVKDDGVVKLEVKYTIKTGTPNPQSDSLQLTI